MTMPPPPRLRVLAFAASMWGDAVAQKRMFSLQVVDTDKFMDMPTSSQALYFHLGMHGDDDGFVSSPRKIARAAGCNDDDMRLLAAKGFIIPFDSGVVVITDWRINNTLQNDRYKETIYQDEKALLQSEKSGKYLLGSNMVPECIHDGTNLEPQHNLTKHNLTKPNKAEGLGADKPPAPTRKPKKSFGEFGWIKLTDDEYNRLLNDFGEAEVKRCIAYVDESAQSTGNKNKWKDWNLVVRKCHNQGWGLNQRQQQKNGSGEHAVDRLARMYKEEFGE